MLLAFFAALLTEALPLASAGWFKKFFSRTNLLAVLLNLRISPSLSLTLKAQLSTFSTVRLCGGG